MAGSAAAERSAARSADPRAHAAACGAGRGGGGTRRGAVFLSARVGAAHPARGAVRLRAAAGARRRGGGDGPWTTVSTLSAGVIAGGRRPFVRAFDVTLRPRGVGGRRQRDDSRLSRTRRPHAAARHLGQGAGVAFDAGQRRGRRARGTDDADRRGDRRDGGAGAGSRRAGAAHPVHRRGGGRHRRGVSHAARCGASGRRGAVSRRLRSRRADSGDSVERRRLFGGDRDLRRVAAVRARAGLSLRAVAPAAVHAAGALHLSFGDCLRLVAANRAEAGEAAAWSGVAAAGPRRPGVGCGVCADRRRIRTLAQRTGTGSGTVRRRLRRGAAGDHRCQLAAGKLAGRRAAAAFVPGQTLRGVDHRRVGRQCGRLRAVAGARCAAGRGVRARDVADPARSAHRSGGLRAGRHGGRFTAASRTHRCRRWSSPASWPAATTCWCR